MLIYGIIMVAQTLPCAEKRCKSNMSLIEEKDNVLYYRCLEKHNEHYFRYDVTQKQWERLIIARKLVLHFEQDPCGKPVVHSATADAVSDNFELDKSVIDEFENSLLIPVEVPVNAPLDVPVAVSVEEGLSGQVNEKIEIASDLMNIKGIGSKNAEKLGLAGVKTVFDLAKCSASNLSEKTGIPTSKLLNWIVKAKTLAEEQVMIPA